MTDDALTNYLVSSAEWPFVWGECDCCLWAGDWVALRTGRDPALTLRGAYGSREGAALVSGREGGLVELLTSLASRVGLVETIDPQPEDVGIVDGGIAPVLAIKVREGWAVKAPVGVSVSDFPLIKAWSVQPC